MSPRYILQAGLSLVSHEWLSLSLLGLLVARFLLLRGRRSLPTPPGPNVSIFGIWKGVKMPTSYQWLTYCEWKKTYGDMIFLNVFRNPILVINSVQVAQDLLERKSAIYSSRPIRVMQGEIMGFNFLFTGMKYDSWYRQHRTMFHQHFQHKVVSKYHTLQQRHTHTLLRNLARTPQALEYIVRRTTAAIVLEICYGIHVADAGDEYVSLADQALAGISSSGNFGTFLVDYIPVLKYIPTWIPGAHFKREGIKWRRLSSRLFNYAFDSVKQKLEDGCAEPSLMTTELESLFREAPKRSQAVERETIIKDVVATTYAAGSDTTLSSLLTFVLAMVLNPDVQLKAQSQLDEVVPKDRLPQFSDRDRLPFITYIVWECLRWHPPVHISLGHYLTEDDEYRSYKLPRGMRPTAMLHDPEHYPEPTKFHPERYIDTDDNRAKNMNSNPELAFGFGRRICPGRFLAADTMWIVVASVLFSYRICKAVDNQGNELEPEVEYSTGLISLPKPFKYRMIPRSADTEILIEATANQ
ncbi:cytochrome P450 [Mycena rebaudengoi]|nr:cytochrome P450 [Mycena rebaudengoi]